MLHISEINIENGKDHQNHSNNFFVVYITVWEK